MYTTLTTKGDETIAIEVETGKSDIEANIRKLSHLTDSQVIFYAVNREVEGKIKDPLYKLKVDV